MLSKKYKKFSLAVILILLIFFSLRLPGLGTDISNSDAARWHRRSSDFLTALKSKDFRSTYQHYQPGVTIMWLDSVVSQISFKQQLASGKTPQTLENSDYYPLLHKYTKSLIVFVLSAFLVLQMFLIKRLFNSNVAILFGIFMSVEPYLVGIDRWFHLTSLETYSSFASFLLLLVWYKSSERKYLFGSAIVLAFSVLSKLTSLILGPIFLIIMLLKFKEKKDFSILYFALIFVFFVFVGFPALITDSLFVFEKLSFAIFKAVGADIRAEILSPYIKPIYYLAILFVKLSPLTFVLAIFTFGNFKRLAKNKLVVLVLLNLVFYFVFLTLASQKIDRYAIVLFPSLILLVSIFVNSLSHRVKVALVGISLVVMGFVTLMHYPVYSAYYSPLIGGTKGALNVGLYDNSGEYYAQAAQFLRTKDRNTYTYLPYNYEAFSYFYNGKMQRSFTPETNYIVTSLNHLDPIPECTKVVAAFGSKDASIVYVFSCD